MTRRRHLAHLHNQKSDRSLYVRGFSEKMADARLRSVFGGWGRVEEAHVQVNREGQSKGFGFVCFVGVPDAKRCLSEAALLIVDGRQLYVASYVPAERRRQKVPCREQLNAKEKVRAEVMVIGDDAQHRRKTLLIRIRVMSEDQAASLAEDAGLLGWWMALP
jgi:RNA recognition motif-containing protein